MTRRLVAAVAAVAVLAGAGGYVLGGRRAEPPPAPVVAGAARQLWTCGMHPQVLQDHPGHCPICGMALTPVDATSAPPGPHDAGRAVTIDPVVEQNMGIRVAVATVAPLRTTIRATGILAEAEPRRHDINLRVSGWIERLHAATEGMHVVAGAPLFDLYSPELQVAVEELIAARRAGGDGAVLAGAAARKLRFLGLDEAEVARLARLDHAPATITFTSPVDGHVIEKEVVEGAAVEAGKRVMRIVDHSVLWLDAQVFERDLPRVHVGQTATARLPGRAEPYTGRVVFLHPHVDHETRTSIVRLEVPNPGMTLRPGMFATVEIATDAAEPVLQIPRAAVIDTGERQVVFLAEARGRFVPRRVTTGVETGDDAVEIVDGLAPGDVVVTSGQFLLDAESRFREAIAKHLGERLLSPPADEPPATPPVHVH
jgi:Cu(I)/Ag(I) efflux system membrane fusion protein